MTECTNYVNSFSNEIFIKKTKEYREKINQQVSTRVTSDSSPNKDSPSLIDSMIQSFGNEIFIKKTKEYREKINQQVSTRVTSDSSPNKDRPSLINSMIHMIENNECVLTQKEIIGEINWTIIAGMETTAISLSFTMMLLGFHQDVQRKAQQELDALFGDDVERSVSMEDINSLKYTEQVIKESLRLYPVAPFLPRTSTEDIEITN
uniref:Cytochrome P450 n=1 Tax=Timema monikensis TaxID=170555 RepID=A0A7R9HTZ7_9NEOP|nr:unnamed protein product [Timema monikensis]